MEPDPTPFSTRRLPDDPDTVAPDGSLVRVLLRLDRGSAAHFALAPGATSIAAAHRHVDEVWYVLTGRGEMWRRAGGREEVVALEPGVCLTIPARTAFQFRSTGEEPLTAFAVTMPPWPAEGDADRVAGRWP
jgi:mannose-6-phosphate isomerase-like protein (cupin superfamily)